MDPDRLERARSLVVRGVGLGAAELEEFLARECGADDALRAIVRELLGGPTLAAPVAPVPLPAPPGFRLLSELGRGSMGVVYLAEQEKLERTIALKLIRADSVDPEMLERFEQEARVLARMEHPGIARIFDYGHSGSVDRPQPFIVMEFVRGKPFCSANCVELRVHERIELLIAAVRAVQHAHEKHVVHRDLKPANVLLDAQGGVKVLDFGIARLEDARRAKLTGTGDVIGSPLYMSPEQIRGEETTGLSDVFALGVLGYEVLSGRHPFAEHDDRVMQVLVKIESGLARPIRQAMPSLDRDLECIFVRALQREARDRYASAAAFADDLQRWLDGRPVLARQGGAGYVATKWVTRHRELVFFAAAVVVLAIGGLIALQVKRVRAAEAHLLRIRSDLAEAERLVAEVDELWPAVPAKIPAMEQWLARARALLAGDGPETGEKAYQAELLEVRNRGHEVLDAPQSSTGEASRLRSLIHVLSAALDRRENRAAPPDPEEWSRPVDMMQFGSTPRELLQVAHDMLFSELRSGRADYNLGLRIAEHLRDRLEPEERWEALQCLARARFLHGQDAEARGLADEAVSAAPADRRAEMEAWARRLDGLIEEERPHDRRTQVRTDLTELRSRLQVLEDMSTGENRWEFDAPSDRERQAALARLVPLQHELSIAEGRLVAGEHPSKGMSVERRLAAARRSESELRSRNWADAIASIRDVTQCPAYAGLELEPQLGLVPISRDRSSGLWEFAVPSTGVVPARDANGRLALSPESALILVLIPGGVLLAPEPQNTDPLGLHYDPELAGQVQPRHVEVRPFFLSKYEVTQGQWLRLTGHNPSAITPGKLYGGHLVTLLNPVENLTWREAVLWLSRCGLALPSEDQWAWAAQARHPEARWPGEARYESLDEGCNAADRTAFEVKKVSPELFDHSLEDGWVTHATVDQFLPNEFGLNNMAGNVAEWCADVWEPLDSDQKAPEGGNVFRATRGGHYFNLPSDCGIAARVGHEEWVPSNSIGVRPAREIDRSGQETAR